MSIEKARTGKPSRFLNDEGWQERTGQPLESAQRSGGVSGDGMLGRADGITRETCPRGAQAPTPGTTLETGKAGAARAGVGVLHSSEEVLVTGMERRRGGCADANGAARTRRWPERDSNTHDARIGIGSSKSAIDALTDERKESDKQHSESRMREIRTSGLMRGRPERSLASGLSFRQVLPTLLNRRLAQPLHNSQPIRRVGLPPKSCTHEEQPQGRVARCPARAALSGKCWRELSGARRPNPGP